MGKYDEDLSRFVKARQAESVGSKLTPIEFFLCKIANELAENNRLIRQDQCREPGEYYDVETNVDKA